MLKKDKLVIFDRVAYISIILFIMFLTIDLFKTHYIESLNVTTYIFVGFIFMIALIYCATRLKDLFNIFVNKTKCKKLFIKDKERFVRSKKIFKIKLIMKLILFSAYMHLYINNHLSRSFLITLIFVIVTPDIYRHYKFRD